MNEEVGINPVELLTQLEATAKSIKARAKAGNTSATRVMQELSGTVMPTLLKVVALVGNQGSAIQELTDRLDDLEDSEVQSQLLPEDARVILDALTLCRPLAEIEDQASTLAAIDKAIQLVNDVVLQELDEEDPTPEGEHDQEEEAAPAAAAPPASPPEAPAN